MTQYPIIPFCSPHFAKTKVEAETLQDMLESYENILKSHEDMPKLHVADSCPPARNPRHSAACTATTFVCDERKVKGTEKRPAQNKESSPVLINENAGPAAMRKMKSETRLVI
jgi:hypothetical protein